ncbi:CxxH/CxxC protein [Bacillus songklensis]|uniref:CxxH/CxxC protein n=1 Tax=Bacillus songklensis TaxID=1069116 RepID=A0ABV8BA27_9BACI
MKIYCCKEHVELALDIIVDETEMVPVLEEVPEKDIHITCGYCSKEATYVVGN